MRRTWRRSIAAVVALILAMTTGCGPQLSKEQQLSNQQGIPSNNGQEANRLKSEMLNGKTTEIGTGDGTIRMQETGGNQLDIPLLKIGNVNYVNGTDFARMVGFNANWDDQRRVFQLGDNDAEYEFKPDSLSVLKEEQNVTLKEPPVLHKGQVHLPASAFPDLFNEDLSFELRDNSIVIHASDSPVFDAIDGPEEANTGSELDFEDDPDDPFKGDEGNAAATSARLTDEEALPVLRNIDMNALINRGKRYLGVDYKFGAAPYPQSGRFDCSTFTQYVFGLQGIKLNRTARAQAKQGVAVSRKNLRKGDLMFFYVPGRFRSNRTVGHVGIYMGNQKMLHSSPKPQNGVQITSINKAYWKKTYLSARRLAY